MRRQQENRFQIREVRRRRHQQKLRRKVIGCCMVTFLLGVLCGKLVFAKEKDAGSGTQNVAGREAADAQQSVSDLENKFGNEGRLEGQEWFSGEKSDSGAWKLTLVNATHFMEEGYEPVLAEIENNYYLDIRAVEPLQEMLAAGRKEGLDFWICSAYRTNEKQTQLFENKVSRLMEEGLSYEEAYEEAGTVVAYPGTSEHQLGLAVDIVARDYQHLDEQQAQTAEARWLAENCWKYGFILRYPVDKTEETGIIYEPWHYRYVGKDAAKEIMEQGICLEEYLNEQTQLPAGAGTAD